MAEQPKRSSRRQKIEPLDYAEAAQAPALKGMTSFLDLSPEDVRRGNFAGLNTPSLPSSPDHLSSEVYGSDVSSPPLMVSSNGNYGADVSTPRGETTPVHKTFSRIPRVPLDAGSSRLTNSINGAVLAPAVVSPPGVETTPTVVPIPDNGTNREMDSTRTPKSSPVIISSLEGVSSPGYETPMGIEEQYVSTDRLIPGRGRSKIRKCVLAQDGHSLGEEAIYQALWKTGKPETNDSNGARIIRIGSSEIGFKVNMSKKNVRQNIARLYEKLALEISENFETSNSQARTYRVFSYKQILERRRAAGMEYVLRNKGVVFCSRNGKEIVSSPVYVSSPGGETPIRPGVPKKRRRIAASSNGSKALVYPIVVGETAPVLSEDADLALVVEALNRYWSVDQAAAVQLLRDCRRIRPDARAEEVAFFVQEKLELARQNRNITNPTGLILSMVPQSFVGTAFEEFRRRMERQARLAAEEKERQEQQTIQLKQWLLAEREKYESILNDPLSSQRERDDAENKLRQYASWNQ